jgi:hypothetical protein
VIECNADLDHPCDADDGDPCPSCKETMAYYRALYEHARPDEREDARAARDPEFAHAREEAFNEELRDAGRGHLIRSAS